MKKLILILIIAVSFICHGPGQSADDTFALNVLADVESQAITMIKDRDGFLWVGTYVDGVYRYDGKSLKHYGPASGLIKTNSVQSIVEDDDGNIWFASSGSGLTRFDKETNRITHYSHDPDNPNSLSSNTGLCCRRYNRCRGFTDARFFRSFNNRRFVFGSDAEIKRLVPI